MIDIATSKTTVEEYTQKVHAALQAVLNHELADNLRALADSLITRKS